MIAFVVADNDAAVDDELRADAEATVFWLRAHVPTDDYAASYAVETVERMLEALNTAAS